MTNTLFISTQYLKQNTPIQQNVDDETIHPFIALAQDKYILDVLGTALYNRLTTDVQNNTLSGNYLTLMQTYVQKTLAFFTLAESIKFLNYQITNKSILTKNSENSSAVDLDVTIALERSILDSASYYSQRMINFLRANYTLYPELVNTGANVATIFPAKTEYFSGIHIPNLPLDEILRRRRENGNYGYFDNGFWY